MTPLSRDFTTPWQGRAVQDVLQSLLLAELVHPSAELWLLSAWITDVEVIDNSARAFAGVRPDWPKSRIRLSSVLEALVGRGGRVAVVLREVEHNEPFVRRLKAIQKLSPNRLGLTISASAHEKALIGDDYVLGGSMNITMSGLTHSDEHVLLRVDPEVAAQRRMALSARWGGQLSWG